MKPPVRITHGVRWELQEEVGDLLLGPRGLRLPEWLASGQARVVKQTTQRTVYQVSLPDLDFHLKYCRCVGIRDRLRAWLRPSKARLEYERSLALAQRGVATLVPLALGETCKGAGPPCSFLITRTIAGAEPLHHFLRDTFPLLPSCRQVALRQSLARALGGFLARLHQAGVWHPDLHPGNLLVHGSVDHPELHLIDLHAIRMGQPLSWPARRASLVMLNRWFILRSQRSDRLRCWFAYQRADPEGEMLVSARRRISEIERSTEQSNVSFWLDQDRRSLGGNRHYQSFHRQQMKGYRVADLPDAVLDALLRNPDGLFSRPEVRILKQSPSVTMAELPLPAGERGGEAGPPRQVILKRFPVTKWTDPLVSLFRPPSALRSYLMGHGLRVRCLPTPRPLAVWHRYRYGLLHEGYLLLEKVPDSLDLRTYVGLLGGKPQAQRTSQLRDLIERLARLVRSLHARQVSHRDLKAGNLLVSLAGWRISDRGIEETEAQETPQIWFVDLVGVRPQQHLSRARRVQNLARLHVSFFDHPLVSRTEKLRFLRVYLRGEESGKKWKAWWKEIYQSTMAKLERNVRLGRPIA
jgi:tRNA A-37 threonylcarbamoyl transferase component Bud32